MDNNIKLSMTSEEMLYIISDLNQEVSELFHSEGRLDMLHREILVTHKLMEKIMYYLPEGYLKDRLQFQIQKQK